MSIDDYRRALSDRERVRSIYAALAGSVDACVTLSAPGAAPLGLASTGDMSFAVPASLLGVPAVTLPLLEEDGMPVGLQLIGFQQRDADLFAASRWVMDTLEDSAI